MGFLSSIFGGDTEVTTTTTSNVTVSPETNVVNVIDLEPIQRLVDRLSLTDEKTAETHAASIRALADQSQEREAAAEKFKTMALALMAGVSVLALAKGRG